MDNRDLLTAGMVAGAVWNMSGFAIQSFARLWPTSAIPVAPVSFGLTAARIAAIPLSRSRDSTSLGIAAGIEAINTVWSLMGVATLDTARKLGPAPAIVAPGAAALLSGLATWFGVRAAREHR